MDTSKLPKWAQEYIKELERQRDMAIRTLNEFQDEQTPSPFYFEDAPCTGEHRGPTIKRRYVQAHKMQVEHAGILLTILPRDDYLELSWGNPNLHTHPEIALIPSSSQQVRLVSKENMR